MSMTKLVLLDVAGTTVVDNGIVVRAFLDGMSNSKISVSDSQLETMVDYVNQTMGQRKIDVFLNLFDGDEDKANLLHQEFIKAHEKLVKEGIVEPIPGVVDLFLNLKYQGLRVGLTTGFPREILGQIISAFNWGKYLDVTVAASEVPKGRPAPDMILRGISLIKKGYGIDASNGNTAVVGDTPSDMMSGVAAKCKLIVGVKSGIGTEDELIQAGATHVLTDATHLLSIIY